MTQVIGILGFKGSGKDTAGDHLVQKYGFVRDSFATPLKDAVAATFGWDREMLEGATGESRAWRETPDIWWEQKLDWQDHPGRRVSEHFTPRVALQWFGTEVFRTSFHDSIWIYSLENRLRQQDKVVVTDCRFPNEVSVIRNMGGKIIRVKRGPEPAWYDSAIAALRGEKAAADYMNTLGIHVSEWAWLDEPCDAVIENDGTIQDLTSRLEAATFRYV